MKLVVINTKYKLPIYLKFKGKFENYFNQNILLCVW